ncbi:MAG: HNH endonuclease signature motif containing protein [Candidatus Ferrigenium altingense]
MTAPTEKTLRHLYALSGNICAYPGCSLPMFEASGTLTGEVAHIKARNSLGPRYDENQSDADRHSIENLVLLCRRHHKVVDTEYKMYTVDVLSEIKAIHETVAGRPEIPTDSVFAKLLLNAYNQITIVDNAGNVAINSPGVIQGKVINFKTTKKKIVVTAPSGTIGGDGNAARYVQYLISRYNEFASKDTTRTTRFSFGALSKNIASNFGSEWKFIPIERSNELFAYLQERILKTKLARINKGKGYRAFSTYEDFTIRAHEEDA